MRPCASRPPAPRNAAQGLSPPLLAPVRNLRGGAVTPELHMGRLWVPKKARLFPLFTPDTSPQDRQHRRHFLCLIYIHPAAGSAEH